MAELLEQGLAQSMDSVQVGKAVPWESKPGPFPIRRTTVTIQKCLLGQKNYDVLIL